MSNSDNINIQKEIESLKSRNSKVEKDKAWETSLTRKLIIAILTYITVSSFFLIAELPNPFINALVPSGAFILSTLSLKIFRKIWERFTKTK